MRISLAGRSLLDLYGEEENASFIFHRATIVSVLTLTSKCSHHILEKPDANTYSSYSYG